MFLFSGRTPGRSVSRWQVLGYPQSSAVTFALLTAAVLLSTVFVGDWLYLSVSSPAPGQLPPPGWLAAPALVAIVLTTALVLAAPWILEHRGHLVPVPSDLGGGALRRVPVLAAEIGLRTSPRLLWNPTRSSATAFAYGRPGNYRIALTPSLLGAYRRHPEAFDDVARHELAHVRNGDVLMAMSALYCWYAVLPILAAPLAVRLVDHDWSLVPDYLLRAAGLALLLYLIRAKLLRSREIWADVLAASRAVDPAATARRFAAAAPVGAARSGRIGTSRLALHPTPAQRAAAITHPAALGRPDLGEWLIVGVLVGASVPLVRDLLLGTDPAAASGADIAARILVYLGVGLYAALTLARAAGTGALTRRSPVLLATVLAAGVPIGAAVSLARTGLANMMTHDVAAAAITAVAAASVLTLIGALAQVPAISGTRPLRLAALATTGAVLTGLAAAASLTPSTVIAEGGHIPGLTDMLFVLDAGRPVDVLALACIAVAIAGLVLAHALRAARGPIVLAAAAGLGLSVVLSAVRPILGDLHQDDRVWYYFLAWMWLGVALAIVVGVATTARRAEGLLVGIPAAAVVALVVAAGFVVSADAFGGRLSPADVEHYLALIGAATLAIGLPLAAAALAMKPKARRPARRRKEP
jgi:hypothetical protein